MLNKNSLKQEWQQNGYLIVRSLYDRDRVARLRSICDEILAQWLRESSNPAQTAELINMAFLTEPRYFTNHPEWLIELLNAIADEKILSILAEILDIESQFHNTQYFFNPATRSRAGDWHRDQQFGADSEETQQARMAEAVGMHIHIPFLADNCLELIPGTQARWDTEAEHEIRKGLNGKKPTDEMPGAVRIELEAGDACFFSAWMIHRGNYRSDYFRRTFDILFGSETKWYTPPPTCFLQPNLIEQIDAKKRPVFQRFIDCYRDRWLRGKYEKD